MIGQCNLQFIAFSQFCKNEEQAGRQAMRALTSKKEYLSFGCRRNIDSVTEKEIVKGIIIDNKLDILVTSLRCVLKISRSLKASEKGPSVGLKAKMALVIESVEMN